MKYLELCFDLLMRLLGFVIVAFLILFNAKD